MPTQFDNMSVDENPAPLALSPAQNNFSNVVRLGGDLPGAWGGLVREMRSVLAPNQSPSALCDNLNAFIERNDLRRAYLDSFKDCVGDDAQIIRSSLHNFATRAGFNSIEEYFSSQPQRSNMFKLGLGSDSDSNPVSDLGNRVRRALRIVYNAGAGGEYNLFFISFFHFHRFILCTYFNYTNSIFSSTSNPTGGALSWHPPNTYASYRLLQSIPPIQS